MFSLATLYDYVIPIGAIISIIIILLLMKSIQSFPTYSDNTKKTKMRQLQLSSIIVFITYILFNVGCIMGRWVFDVKACSLRVPMVSCLWCFTRAAIYFFFLIRGQLSFAGSAYAFKPLFIKAFQAFIIILYLIYAICHVTTAHHIQFNETDRICVPTEKGAPVVYGFVYPFLLVDFLIGVVICGLFAHKLWTLQHHINATVEESDTNEHENFIMIAKKQTKLAFVSYMASLIALYIMPATQFLSFPFIDPSINALCVYCTFSLEMPRKVYRYLCECNGNKCCLSVFCFCCWCCNVPPKAVRIDGTQPDLKRVASLSNRKIACEGNKPSNVDIVKTNAVDTTRDVSS